MNKYTKLVEKYKEETRLAQEVENKRINELALKAPESIEKYLDQFITERAKMGLNYLYIYERLDSIHSKTNEDCRFRTTNEAYQIIIQTTINFCKREGLKYNTNAFTIHWD